jgi:hypothetical protein
MFLIGPKNPSFSYLPSPAPRLGETIEALWVAALAATLALAMIQFPTRTRFSAFAQEE